MTNKKGAGLAETIILVGAIFILLSGLYALNSKLEGTHTLNIGTRQFTVFNYAERAFIAQSYLDSSAQKSLDYFILEMAQSGGHINGSACGTYGGFSFWRNKTDDCMPAFIEGSVSKQEYELSSAVKEIMYPRLDAYLEKYPTTSMNELLLLENFKDPQISIEEGFEVSDIGKHAWKFGDLYYPKELEVFPVEGFPGGPRISPIKTTQIYKKVRGGEVAFENNWHNSREGGIRYHQGIDILAPKDFNILAAMGGTVTKVGCTGYGGNRVGITDDNGNYFYYAHLDTIAADIVEGLELDAGHVLGTNGNTIGCVKGCTGKDCGIAKDPNDVYYHLHFAIYVSPTQHEESIKQTSAYNPYYSLRATLDTVYDVFDVAQFPPSEYRHIPQFNVKRGYGIKEYQQIWDDIQKLEEECGPFPYCIKDKLILPSLWVEKMPEGAQPEDEPEEEPPEDNPLENLLNPDPEPFVPSTEPEPVDESNVVVPLEGLVVGDIIPAFAADETGFDWIIEYNGQVITEENGINERMKWNMYCETPEERILADFSELVQNCTYTTDNNCVCERHTNFDREEYHGYQRNHGFSNRYSFTLTESTPSNPPEPLFSTMTLEDPSIVRSINPLYGDIWLPISMELLQGFGYSYSFQEPNSDNIISNTKRKHLYVHRRPNPEDSDSSLITFLRSNHATNDKMFVTMDGQVNIENIDEAKKCKPPKILKVCVLDLRNELPREHIQYGEDDPYEAEKVMDFAPITYRFAYHLKNRIPDPITSLEIQDKFRMSNSVVLKWEASSFDEVETYNLYYSQQDVFGFLKTQLDELVLESADESTPENEKFFKKTFTRDTATVHEGDVNINYMYYNARAGERLYVTTIPPETPEELPEYDLVELHPGQFYHFTNPHYVYVVRDIPDGTIFNFVVIPENDEGETSEEPTYPVPAASIDDGPPPPIEEFVCEYVGGDLICTFNPLSENTEFLMYVIAYEDANGDMQFDRRQLSLDDIELTEDNKLKVNVNFLAPSGVTIQKVTFGAGRMIQKSGEMIEDGQPTTETVLGEGTQNTLVSNFAAVAEIDSNNVKYELPDLQLTDEEKKKEIESSLPKWVQDFAENAFNALFGGGE